MKVSKILATALLLSAPLFTTGCIFDVHEDKDDYEDDIIYQDNYHYDSYYSHLPGNWSDQVVACDENEERLEVLGLVRCVKQDNLRWMTNCNSEDCQEIGINVHYMLIEDLGYENRVVVEAFDNGQFTGKPVSTLELTNYDASRPGIKSDAVMFLEPGEYYFRAYISNQETVVPYEYQGMELVSDRPVGFYGALSAATKTLVRPENEVYRNKDVNIYLDKLMKKEGMEILTDAHLRVKMSLPEGFEVPSNRKVFVELFDQDDFMFDPVYSFEVASENFKIADQFGDTEFISPDLKIESYYVRAYLDLSGNGYYDVGEPIAYYTSNGELRLVKMIKSRTELIEMDLQVEEMTGLVGVGN